MKVPNPKLIQMLAYIWSHMGKPRSPTKLFWLVFNADFESYARYGESISGATWRKGRTCPIPDLRWAPEKTEPKAKVR